MYTCDWSRLIHGLSSKYTRASLRVGACVRCLDSAERREAGTGVDRASDVKETGESSDGIRGRSRVVCWLLTAYVGFYQCWDGERDGGRAEGRGENGQGRIRAAAGAGRKVDGSPRGKEGRRIIYQA